MFTLPLGQRRVAQFKANRRGRWSLWLFIGLCLICLGGELIANDKPLVIRYHDAFTSRSSAITWKPISAASCRFSRITPAATCTN